MLRNGLCPKGSIKTKFENFFQYRANLQIPSSDFITEQQEAFNWPTGERGVVPLAERHKIQLSIFLAKGGMPN